MPRIIAVRLVLIAGIMCVPAYGYAGTLVTEIDTCIRTTSKAQRVSNEKIKIKLDRYCPGLSQSIRRSSISKSLSNRFDSVSSIAELRDIRQFLVLYKPANRKPYSFDYSAVDPLIDEILVEAPKEQKDLWEQFFQWLKQYLPTPDKKDVDRIDKFLKLISIPAWINKAILYVSAGLILLAAFWVLYREWKYYRIVGPRGRKSRKAAQKFLEAENVDTPVSLEAISALPIKHRIPALLNWVISRFVQLGVLPENRSLTNRELLSILGKQHSQDSYYFQDLINATELLVYGNALANEDQAKTLIERAKSIQNESEVEVS